VLREVTWRSEENLARNINRLQECDSLIGTIEEIRVQINNDDIQKIRNETEAMYEKKVQTDQFSLSLL